MLYLTIQKGGPYMVNIFNKLRAQIDDLSHLYDEALICINDLKTSLLSRIDFPFVDTAEEKFLLDSIERKTNKKILSIKNESKKVLISTNLEKKVKFIDKLEKVTIDELIEYKSKKRVPAQHEK